MSQSIKMHQRLLVSSRSSDYYWIISNRLEPLKRPLVDCLASKDSPWVATMINKSFIEERFGLKTVLNIAKNDDLRQIRKNEIAQKSRRTREQLPQKSDIHDFSIDIEQDLLEGITVSVQRDGLISGTLTGSDSIRLSTECNIDNIDELLTELLGIYFDDNYKESFGWIDHIKAVRDANLIEVLENVAFQSLKTQGSEVYFAVPEVINWENIDGFKIAGHRQRLFSDIDTDMVLSSYRTGLSSFQQLNNKRITAVDSSTGQARHSWNADKCLFGELDYGDSSYCINGGRWYEIDKNFVKSVERYYESTPLSEIQFPPCSDKNEDNYNIHFANGDPDQYLLMDKNLIYHGGGQNKVELCDILSKNHTFIHIKHYGGSQTLCHLFNQGHVSAQLLISDREFVEKTNRKIHELTATDAGFNQDGTVKSVVFAIISENDAPLPRIPLFSKLAFQRIRKDLESRNVKVSIANVIDRYKIENSSKSHGC